MNIILLSHCTKLNLLNTPLPFEDHNYGTVLYQQIIKKYSFQLFKSKIKTHCFNIIDEKQYF